jgi:NADPH-dependent 2,4-dienoyl-CoA reductase/sulfur reductase-like enzyme
MTGPLSFEFNGTPLDARSGQSLAAALTEAGERHFRDTDAGGARGIFCGMGVCQDCLVTIDGTPNQRACMTPVTPGMVVTRQAARPPLTAPPASPKQATKLTPEVLIIGGGAAGLEAGIAARAAGTKVLLLDERKVSGGQYFKQSALPDATPLDPQQADGAALVAKARQAGVEIQSGVEVWGAFDGPVIMASSATDVFAITPGKLIVATGAYERPAMIPGWTLPGVMTAGAAQTLWRSYRVPPGKRVAVFGNGPLNAQVALELCQGGAEIALLAEAAPAGWHRPISAAQMALRDPALAWKGAKMLSALSRHGVPVRWNTLPLEIAETSEGLRVRYAQRGKVSDVTVDAVCLNFGFQPQNEILRLLGAEMSYDARFDQLRPTRSAEMATSVADVYAIGDCCGLGGAPAAAVEGRIAGRAAVGGGPATAADEAELTRHRRFQDALWQVYAAEVPKVENAPPETLICRCEEVSYGTLSAALATGAEDIGAVKRATRIGMGRCQGRYCAPALAGILAHRHGRALEDLSYFAPRVPIKPVDIGTLVATEPLLDDSSGDG